MNDSEKLRAAIVGGKTYLGIELGSTRIKAVLIDETNRPIASGAHDWENQLVDGVWTYSLDAIWNGLRDCYAKLADDVYKQFGCKLTTVGAMGISAMMHGYMPFDKQGTLLVPFRTWRNTITGEASEKLTALFNYNIPQRWSIAHLYQAILNGEDHVGSIDFLTTLAGYLHWQLTGEKVVGVGEASGMFPINISTRDYDADMIAKFDAAVADKGFSWKLGDILPKSLPAGTAAGVLTEEGAKLLDPSGNLKAGIPLCPPEGDAGTGMTATNAVAPRTGNVSAGTSVFAMIVLEKELSEVHPEIDLVTTPSGDLVAMVHCNSCTSDINEWVALFEDFAEAIGAPQSKNRLYETLFNKALEGDADCGGMLAYNYYSGEPVTGLENGRPLYTRLPDSKMSLANFMRTHLYTACGALATGMDILIKKEKIAVDNITGHGGFFKTPGVGQRIMAAALKSPVTVTETAGEGGPWGMAVLAEYMALRAEGESLEDFLTNNVFSGSVSVTMAPDVKDVEGFEKFMERYSAGLAIEQAAVDSLK